MVLRVTLTNGLGPHWRYAAFLQNAPILQLSIPRVPPWAGMRSPVGAGDDRLDLPSESNGPHVHGPPSTVHRPWFMVHESMRSMNVLWLAFEVPQRGTACVNMILKRLTGERPSTVLAWHRVAEGNCVAVRRGGAA